MLKFWSFKRPVIAKGGTEQPASLLFSNAIMGRSRGGNNKV